LKAGIRGLQEQIPVRPLFVINEAIERIKNGTITGYTYDPKTALAKAAS
jgi:hypothetical protein